MDSTSASSSSDEEFIANALPRPRYFRDRSNPLTEFDDIDFMQRFR